MEKNVPGPAPAAAVKPYTWPRARFAPALLWAAVVTVVSTVSPGRKSVAGSKVRVEPLTLAVPPCAPLIRPPRCWLKTFTAPAVAGPVLIGWLKVTATLAARGAERRLRAGLRAETTGA